MCISLVSLCPLCVLSFLKALLEPKIQYNPEPSDSEHFHLVVLASSAIAYTVASESADGAPGLHLFSLSGEQTSRKNCVVNMGLIRSSSLNDLYFW